MNALRGEPVQALAKKAPRAQIDVVVRMTAFDAHVSATSPPLGLTVARELQASPSCGGCAGVGSLVAAAAITRVASRSMRACSSSCMASRMKSRSPPERRASRRSVRADWSRAVVAFSFVIPARTG